MLPEDRPVSDPGDDEFVWPPPLSDGEVLTFERSTVPDDPPPAAAGSVPVTLSTVLDNESAMEWHDAVAVVQQLAEHCVRGGARGSIPPISDIAIESNGRLRVRLGPSGSESTVRGLGRVLNQLLDGRIVPAGLRLIALQAVSDASTIESTSDLIQLLSRFERPDRLRKLTDLYSRASAVQANRPSVPAPISGAPKPASRLSSAEIESVENAAARSPQPVGRLRRIGAITLATAVVCAGVVGVARMMMPSRSTPAPLPQITSRPVPQSSQDVSPDAGTNSRETRVDRKVAESQRSSPSSVPARVNSTPASRPRPALSAGGSAAVDAGALPPLTRELSPNRDGESGLRPNSANERAEVESVGDRQTVERRIYSVDDPGVVAPVLPRPYLPQPPPNIPPTRSVGVLEVVVDMKGRVESVRLRSPGNRYRDRWWVSVAKNWRFRPALKDGQPVRFRTQVLLTDFPEPVK